MGGVAGTRLRLSHRRHTKWEGGSSCIYCVRVRSEPPRPYGWGAGLRGSAPPPPLVGEVHRWVRHGKPRCALCSQQLDMYSTYMYSTPLYSADTVRQQRQGGSAAGARRAAPTAGPHPRVGDAAATLRRRSVLAAARGRPRPRTPWVFRDPLAGLLIGRWSRAGSSFARGGTAPERPVLGETLPRRVAVGVCWQARPLARLLAPPPPAPLPTVVAHPGGPVSTASSSIGTIVPDVLVTPRFGRAPPPPPLCAVCSTVGDVRGVAPRGARRLGLVCDGRHRRWGRRRPRRRRRVVDAAVVDDGAPHGGRPAA